MTFTVYADKIDEVVKRLDRLAAKAARYSVPFAYSVGAEYAHKVSIYTVDTVSKTKYVKGSYTVAAIDVEVECETWIKANGWTLRAKCEHGDQGNIVSAIGSKPVEPAWFTAPARCDHCKTNRFRSVTYFVEHENGAIRQVGRACLHEYTGINPATAALWAEIRETLAADFYLDEDAWEARKLAPMYDVLLVIAHACDVIKAFGYHKSDERDSTKDQVIDRVLGGKAPSLEAWTRAEVIIAWLLGLEEVQGYAISDLEQNCVNMVRGGYVRVKHFGRLAYMPVAYEKFLERMAREEVRRAAAEIETKSEHVGQVGERITIKAATAKLVTSWENEFGTTYLYKFTDERGNVFIWYASRGIAVEDGMTLKGTVKNHNERDGVKQTVITRCKAA